MCIISFSPYNRPLSQLTRRQKGSETLQYMAELGTGSKAQVPLSTMLPLLVFSGENLEDRDHQLKKQTFPQSHSLKTTTFS